jgi:copper chaperone CopZ
MVVLQKKTMKKLLVIFSLVLTTTVAKAEFVSAQLKVTGVTCSMCSNSVQKALKTLVFIENIDVDLENAVFKLTFRPGEKVQIEEIQKKVEDAGFSVGKLVIDFRFDQLAVDKDYHYQYEDNTYHFVNVKHQVLEKIVPITFVDKGLTSLKEHKKYVRLTSYECIKTGKMESCCKISTTNRIYHVTL